jgi:hypothetical protein
MQSELGQGNMDVNRNDMLEQLGWNRGEYAKQQQQQQGQQGMSIIGNVLSALGNNQGGGGTKAMSTTGSALQVAPQRSAYTINNSGYNTQFLDNPALKSRYQYLLK